MTSPAYKGQPTRRVTAVADNVVLPNGARLDSGDTADLTEEEFAKIPSGLFPGTLTVAGIDTAGATDAEVATAVEAVAAPAALTATAAAGATPTKAEFDALLADVTALRNTVVALRTALSNLDA